MFEQLESRKLLTDIALNTTELWEFNAALDWARNDPDPDAEVIYWNDGVSGTVVLAGDNLDVPNNVTIRGGGRITFDAQGNSRIFHIGPGANVTLDGLTLTGGNWQQGGAIHNKGYLTLINTTVTGNTSPTTGGAIFNYDGSSLTMTGSRVTSNTAPNEAGGGIYSQSYSTVNILNSTIADNSAVGGGGGLFLPSNASLTITGSTISGNFGGSGAGIFYGGDRAYLIVANCTIARNTSVYSGGGVFGDGVFQNSTIAFNHSGGSGGGVYSISSNSILVSTIVANNTADYGGNDFFGSVSTAESYNNLIGDSGSTGGLFTGDGNGNLTGVDPLFDSGSVFDHGGPTQTLGILAGSPARHAGLNTGSGGSYDQRGAPFARNGNQPDIGAFEYQESPLSIVVDSAADDNDGDYSAGRLSLREAFNIALYTDGSDTITFSSSLNNQTIVLGSALFTQRDVTINGPGADLLAISGNSAHRVFNFYSGTTVAISGLTIKDGLASGDGGAAISSRGNLTLANVAITNNAATGGPGGAVSCSGTFTITGSTFSGNSSDYSGGGLYATGSATITNSTFVGNSSGGGVGGAIANEGTMTLSNCTITGNTAGAYAGGVNNGSGSLTMHSTIVAGNTGGDVGGTLDASSSKNLIGSSDFNGGLSNGVNGNIVGVATDQLKLGTLGYTGGRTQTVPLLGGSPAVGRGSNPLSLANDQRGDGFLRARFGQPDIGAFEAVRPTLGGFTSSSGSIVQGQSVTLTTSGVVDGDGSIASVSFYRDTNANGVGDSGELIGTDTSSGDAWYSATFDTTSVASGSLSLLAVATDNHGHTSTSSVSVTVTVPGPQTYTVTLSSDESDGDYSANDLSLREAILLANETRGISDTITFSSALINQTITLGGTQLAIHDDVTISGPGAGSLVIDGTGARIFYIASLVTANISGLRLWGGNDQGSGGDGGGAILNAGTLHISDCDFSGNWASARGGAINNLGGLTVESSTFTGNTTPGSGGAIANTGGTLTVRSSYFVVNGAELSGGAIDLFAGTVTVENSTFSANNSGTGGAIFTAGTLIIRQSTFTGNQASDWGGAIAMWDGTIAISNSTIVFNVCDADGTGTATDELGGGVEGGKDVASGVLTIISSIIAGNTRGAPGSRVPFDINLSRGATLSGDSAYNIIGDAAHAGGLTNGANHNFVGVSDAALGLEPLAANGGPTQTMALKSTSRAINMGSNSASYVNDQRGDGYFRVRHGNADIGAYESAFTTPNLAPFSSAAGQLLGASAGPSGNLNITTKNGSGLPIVLQQQGGATNWTGSDLQAKTGSPAITGEVVTWVDSKDGRNYAAGVSAQGVILFTNTSGSSWTFRNLSTEVTGMPLITGNLTTFTSTDRKVNVAGVAASGDLVRYVQTGAGASGNYTWTAVNHGEELRSRGMTMPQFVGRITSFVTSWNALNIVGLDANGQIQAVWWHQSFDTGGKWTTNNLSQEYGAPQLTGGLTVWLTSWNAINIAGTDTSGKLSATWWVAGQNDGRWLTNNLTNDIGGPILQADSMCSWVTPWGAMNIAGREADGTIGVYWWVPGVNGNLWNIEHFREELPSATPTLGPITGVTALAGGFSMSILSTSSTGDVMRLWWTPATDTWAEQNLTQTAASI